MPGPQVALARAERPRIVPGLGPLHHHIAGAGPAAAAEQHGQGVCELPTLKSTIPLAPDQP